jgi:hypothetical protein
MVSRPGLCWIQSDRFPFWKQGISGGKSDASNPDVFLCNPKGVPQDSPGLEQPWVNAITGNLNASGVPQARCRHPPRTCTTHSGLLNA